MTQKIKVVTDSIDNTSGNQLRNIALTHVPERITENFVYFIDDDNVVHPSFWLHMPTYIRSHSAKVYTFAACRHGKYFPGICEVNRIDTAQFVVECNVSSFWTRTYNADGIYVASKCNAYGSYEIHQVMAYYNFLRRGSHKDCPFVTWHPGSTRVLVNKSTLRIE